MTEKEELTKMRGLLRALVEHYCSLSLCDGCTYGNAMLGQGVLGEMKELCVEPNDPHAEANVLNFKKDK